MPFRTCEGSKQQESKLSPLHLGLFIEQLHYLTESEVPGAGPINYRGYAYTYMVLQTMPFLWRGTATAVCANAGAVMCTEVV